MRHLGRVSGSAGRIGSFYTIVSRVSLSLSPTPRTTFFAESHTDTVPRGAGSRDVSYHSTYHITVHYSLDVFIDITRLHAHRAREALHALSHVSGITRERRACASCGSRAYFMLVRSGGAYIEHFNQRKLIFRPPGHEPPSTHISRGSATTTTQPPRRCEHGEEKLMLMKRLLGDILTGTVGDIHPQWALPDHAS